MAAAARSGVNPTDWRVAVGLASFADENGECWPSDAALAELTGLKECSVAAPRRRLRAAGLLDWDVHGHGRRNSYRLVLGPTAPAADGIEDDHQPLEAVDDDNNARQAQRGFEHDNARQTQRGFEPARKTYTAPASAVIPRQAQRADTALLQRDRRDSEVHKGRDTCGSDVSVAPAAGDEYRFDVEAMKSIKGLLRPSDRPNAEKDKLTCSKCHQPVTTSPGEGAPLCVCMIGES